MAEPHPLELLDILPLPGGGAGLVVCMAGSGERLVIWPGEAPPRPPRHGHLAAREGAGESIWVERLPIGGTLLSRLPPPLLPVEGAEILAQVAEGLAALHDLGLAHGALSAAHVALDAQGRVELLGAGLEPGTPAADLAALARLAEVWCPEGPMLVGTSAADAAWGLRTWLSVAEDARPTPTLPARIRAAGWPAPLPGAALVELSWVREEASFDEVGVMLGPDEGEEGLLDARTHPRAPLPGEQTDAVASTIRASAGTDTGTDTGTDGLGGEGEEEVDQPPPSALLAQILQSLQAPADPQRFVGHEQAAAQAIRRLIRSEPLDVLPSPEGMPPGAGSQSWEEHTATQIHLSDLGLPLPSPPPTPPPLQPPTPAAGGPEISVGVLVAAVLGALFAGAAGVWLVLAHLGA